MASGGKREGAGRKPTREKYAGKVAAAEKKIADRLPDIVDAALDLALGVVVQEKDEETGEERIYTKPGCYRSQQYLLNRILGTPTQVQDVTVQDKGPLEVTAGARTQAEKELSEWREKMTETLQSTQNAPPTPPTSPTVTE